MKSCVYCAHSPGYLAWDDDYQEELDICACCYGDPVDPAECAGAFVTLTP
jgi:hypothetical protein